MNAVAEEAYRLALEESPMGVVLVDALDPEHRAVYSNREFSTLTGYSREELLGRNLRFLQGEDREQEARHRLRESMSRGEPCRVLLRNFRKDGGLFWNELTLMPLKDSAGCITLWAGYHRDAGARLRTDPKSSRDSLSGVHQPTAMVIRDDRLTGLFTQPYLEELLKRDWAVAQREGRSIAIFSIDIDALDLYNATFGRAAGDSTIRRVAHVLSGCLRRASDVTARADGGSFLAFARGLDAENALRLANIMTERVRELRIHHPRCTILRYITVSVGVAISVPLAEDAVEVSLEKSQLQMRLAKTAGRNRAMLA